MEKIEIRVEKGLHQAYYKGIQLPFLIDSQIIQGVNKESTEAVLRFRVDLQELNKVSFEINGEGLSDAITKTINRNNSF